MNRSSASLLAAAVAAVAALIAATPQGNVNSIGISLVRIEPGTFEMGVDSTPLPNSLTKGPSGVIYDRPYSFGDYDEAPVHKVTISRPFWMSAAEVTADQYRRFRLKR